MVAAIDRVPVGRIGREAAQLTPGATALALIRTLVTWIAAVLYAVGWLTARTAQALWKAVAWTITAIAIGWKDGLRHGSARTD